MNFTLRESKEILLVFLNRKLYKGWGEMLLFAPGAIFLKDILRFFKVSTCFASLNYKLMNNILTFTKRLRYRLKENKKKMQTIDKYSE